MKQFKFTVIGAGSSYTPDLLEELYNRRETLQAGEIVLYDIDEARLSVMEGFCKRYAAKLGLDTPINSAASLDDALYGADFVDTQIRVGGNKQRIHDEKIPLKYGLVGQETTGAGGMMKAMRTIPAMLEIANRMVELSPDGWIVNYTNPTGLVTEAVTRYTKAKIAGFCSGGLFPMWWVAGALKVPESSVRYDFAGLNHMNFASNITVDGHPLTGEEFAEVSKLNSDSINSDLTRLLGVLPSPYLQYYYHTGERVRHLQSKAQTRGEEVMELEKEIFAAYADETQSDKPEALKKRGGGGYSQVAVGLVEAVHNDKDTWMVVNVPNDGAIKFLPDSAVVEVGCLVNRHGVAPLNVADIPPGCWGLIAAVKDYEQLAVEAAVEGDIRKMKLAMLAHPLIREYELIEKLVPELLEANKEYLPWMK